MAQIFRGSASKCGRVGSGGGITGSARRGLPPVGLAAEEGLATGLELELENMTAYAELGWQGIGTWGSGRRSVADCDWARDVAEDQAGTSSVERPPDEELEDTELDREEQEMKNDGRGNLVWTEAGGL